MSSYSMFEMSQYSMFEMSQMIKVINLLNHHERTLPSRVVVVLCYRDMYVCSAGFSVLLSKSPCSTWEQHRVVSSAMSPYGSGSSSRRWTPPERVVMSLYVSGSCGSRRTPERIVMSAYGGGISGSRRTLAESPPSAQIQRERAVMRPYVRGIWSSIYSFAK